jgi:hypothetical protein
LGLLIVALRADKTMMHDVSPDYRYNKADAKVIAKILPHEATPEAVTLFARHAYKLTDYTYWFLLSTLWVSYTGYSSLDLWRRLLSSTRAGRETGIMKPSELTIFRALPDTLTVYRAHRPEETDWISYTLKPLKAAEFAARRGVDQIKEYRISKSDVIALFLRRGEFEVIVLDTAKAEFLQTIAVVKN